MNSILTYRPVATISWLKDGGPLSNGGHVSITQSGRSLDITSVVSADEGIYTCVAVQSTNTGPVEIRATGGVTVIGECVCGGVGAHASLHAYVHMKMFPTKHVINY